MDQSKGSEKSASGSQAVDFAGLILGFASAALYYLGAAPLEGAQVKEINPILAQQNIDIISLLREKTKGNLTPEENKLIGEVLADLQKQYAAVSG